MNIDRYISHAPEEEKALTMNFFEAAGKYREILDVMVCGDEMSDDMFGAGKTTKQREVGGRVGEVSRMPTEPRTVVRQNGRAGS